MLAPGIIELVKRGGRGAWAIALAMVSSGCTFGSSGASGSGSTADADGSAGDVSGEATVATMSAGTSAGSASADGDGSTAADPSAGSTGPGPVSDTGTDAGTSGTSTGDAGSSSTGTAMTCDKALWVIGDLAVAQTADAELYDRLTTVGYDITLVENAASSPADIADNCVVILSAVGSSGDVGSKFRDVTVPVVVLESYLLDDMQMVMGGTEGVVGGEDIEIVDAGHPMAAGQSGVVSLYLPPAEIGAGQPSGTAQVVATRPAATGAAIFGYELGAMMVGLSAPARRVAFPASGINTAGVSTECLDLFEAAVAWAAP